MINERILSEDVSSLFTSSPNDECITKIGSGNNRVVYAITGDKYRIEPDSYVLKVDADRVENEQEYVAWDYYKDKPISKYLVPIEHHSDNFEWIVMPYLDSVDPSLVDPALYQKLSDMGSDISKTDFVRGQEGNQMCCDYASITAQTL